MTKSDDHTVAADLATEAGSLLLKIRESEGLGDPGALRSTGDRASHEFLLEALARLRPDDSVLSAVATREERLDPRRVRADRGGLVGPPDGTRECPAAAGSR